VKTLAYAELFDAFDIILRALAYAELYTMPCAIMAFATFMKPATLAPFT
jgi:hypothetical protein